MFHLRKTHRLGLMILMTVAYFVVELVVGHVCDSMTLVADSFHMLSDVLALTVALGAVRMSKKPRDRRHTYGFQRAEILGTLINTVMLGTLCFTIVLEALHKIFKPEPVSQPLLIIGVGVGGLVINLVGIMLFCGHSHGHSHGGGSDHAADVDKLLQYKTVVVMSSMPEDDNQQQQQQQPQAAGPDVQANGEVAIIASAADSAAAKDGAATAPAAAGAADADQSGGGGRGEKGADAPLLASDCDSGHHPQSLHHSHHSLRLRRPSLGPSWLSNPALVGDSLAANGAAGGKGHGHSHGARASGGGQMNMQAAFLHIIGDTLGSIIVIISALTLWLTGYSEEHNGHTAVLTNNGTCEIKDAPKVWLAYIDPSLSLLLVGIMLTSTVPLFLRALSILMQTVPQEICLDELRDQLEKIDGIIRVHDLHVWQLQSDCYIGTVHLRCRDLQMSDYINVSREAKKIFHDFNIHCTTIQPEFSEHADSTDRAMSDSQCIIDCGDRCEARANCCANGPANPESAGAEGGGGGGGGADVDGNQQQQQQLGV